MKNILWIFLSATLAAISINIAIWVFQRPAAATTFHDHTTLISQSLHRTTQLRRKWSFELYNVQILKEIKYQLYGFTNLDKMIILKKNRFII